MRTQYVLLFGVSIILAFHALILGRVLESSFFIVAFSWGWMAFSALTGRLEAAKAMALTMIVLLMLAVPIMQTMPFGPGEVRSFYSLAYFPGLVTWVCAYLFVAYMQKGEDVGGKLREAQTRLGQAEAATPFLETRKSPAAFARFMRSTLPDELDPTRPDGNGRSGRARKSVGREATKRSAA